MKKFLSLILALICLMAFQTVSLAEQAEVFLYCPALDAMELTDEDQSGEIGYGEYMTEDGMFLVQVFTFDTTEYGMVGEFTFDELLAELSGGDMQNIEEVDLPSVSFYPARRTRFESGADEEGFIFDASVVWTEQKTFVYIVITGIGTWNGHVDGYEAGDAQALVDLWVSELEIMKSRVSDAYFDQMGYEINYAFGDGEVYLENGGHAYGYGGESFGRLPVLVSMDIDSFNDTQDGFVEIEFTKSVYFDSADYPDFMFRGKWGVGTLGDFYDYYTGYVLRGPATVGDTSKGENYRYFEYESQGRRIFVEYNYSTEWLKHEDSSYTLLEKYFVRMPADYDGIVYAQVEGHPDYETYVTAREKPDDGIVMLDDEKAVNAILCRLNTLE